MKFEEIAQWIWARIVFAINGGSAGQTYTLRVNDGGVIEVDYLRLTSGYLVQWPESPTSKTTVRYMSLSDIERELADWIMLQSDNPESLIVWGWARSKANDDGAVVDFDLSYIEKSRVDALKAAFLNKNDYIFDLASQSSIPVDKNTDTWSRVGTPPIYMEAVRGLKLG